MTELELFGKGEPITYTDIVTEPTAQTGTIQSMHDLIGQNKHKAVTITFMESTTPNSESRTS